MLSKVLFFIAICAFTSCNVAEVVLPSNSDTNAYEVNGQRKLRSARKFCFGNYQAAETKMSRRKGTSFNFSLKGKSVFRKKKQKHKIQFALMNTQSKEVLEVSAIHDVNQSNVNRMKELVAGLEAVFADNDSQVELEEELNPNDYFIGTIRKNNSEKIWRFGISNVSKYSIRNAFGYLQNGDRKIMVSEAGGFTKGWLPDNNEDEKMAYAFHFTEEGKYLGTVRIYKGGKIWIEKGLSSETEEVIAAMSSVFLMKKTE